MIRFIDAEGLDDELRRHDWSGFARGYNGAGYAKHGWFVPDRVNVPSGK